MGGNALSVPTRRYKKNEYFDILVDVIKILNDNGIVGKVPLWYKNKDSFGDLDVLIKSSTVDGNIIDIIKNVFSPNEIYNNGDVKSFDYKEFQIDFIMTSDDKWEPSFVYFSYNDLGNLIGRIAYSMGFRYGHYGLKFVYLHPDGGRKLTKIICKEPKKILTFLGFDYDRFLKGFYEIEDVFDFVIQSKYFNKKLFDYENLNHQNKTRNKKRKNYEKFLEYIKDYNGKNHTFESKQYFINKAEKFFDVELNKIIENFNYKVQLEKEASKKFNGKIIIDKYGLSGKDVGIALKNFYDAINQNFLHVDGDEDTQRIERAMYIINTDSDKLFEIFENVNNVICS